VKTKLTWLIWLAVVIQLTAQNSTTANAPRWEDAQPVYPNSTNATIKPWEKFKAIDFLNGKTNGVSSGFTPPKPEDIVSSGFTPPPLDSIGKDKPAAATPAQKLTFDESDFESKPAASALAKTNPRLDWELVAGCVTLVLLITLSVLIFFWLIRYVRRIGAQIKPADFSSSIVKLITAVLLFAAPGRHAYDYYTLLRCVACGVAAFTAFQAAQNKKFGWLFIFVIVAVMLNPIAPLHLKGETWAFVDAAAAVLFLISIATIEAQTMNSSVKRFLFWILFLLAIFGIMAWFFLRQNVPEKAAPKPAATKLP
jgi:hypothetical protein